LLRGIVTRADAKTARAACALRCKQKKNNNGGQACKIRYEMRKINAAQRPRYKVSDGNWLACHVWLPATGRVEFTLAPLMASLMLSQHAAMSGQFTLLFESMRSSVAWASSQPGPICVAWEECLHQVACSLACFLARRSLTSDCAAWQGRFVKRDSTQTLDGMEADCLGSCASSDVSALSDASWLML